MHHDLALSNLLFLAQVAATLFMVGLIWFVQIVHYPLFAEVGSVSLICYATLHAQRTTWVVFPPMLVELLTSLLAIHPPLRPAFLSAWESWVLAALVAAIWVATALSLVPLHTRLGKPSADSDSVRAIIRLVQLNWIRTLAWTARALLLLYLLWRGM